MRILFLCLGNTGGSPLAMGLLRRKLQENNLEAVVDSAGFEAHLINERPDKLAVEIGKRIGVDIALYRARLFRADDFDKYDYIYAFDSHTYRYAADFARTPGDEAKISYLTDLVGLKNHDIPDILHRGLDNSDDVVATINKACDVIVGMIKKEK